MADVTWLARPLLGSTVNTSTGTAWQTDRAARAARRLTGAFDVLGERASAKACAGMRGIIKEADEDLKADADSAVRDAAIIGAAQKAEHYEIAAYGTARTHANRLGLSV
jgi:ferritin-like metal-binding protein YciE